VIEATIGWARLAQSASGGREERSSQSDPARAATAAASTSIASALQWSVASAIALAGYITVVFFLVFFLLSAGSHFRQRIAEVTGAQGASVDNTLRIIDDIDAQIQRFLIVRFVTAIVVALATWGVLVWMEVPQAAV
jgi:predicted PurR-regulated permease PerM